MHMSDGLHLLLRSLIMTVYVCDILSLLKYDYMYVLRITKKFNLVAASVFSSESTTARCPKRRQDKILKH